MYHFYWDQTDKNPAKILLGNGIFALCSLWSKKASSHGDQYVYVGEATELIIAEIDGKKHYGEANLPDYGIY